MPSPAVWDRQFLGIFLEVYGQVDDDFPHVMKPAWLQMSSEIPNPDIALQHALRANSLVRIGRQHGDETLISSGVWNYCKALKGLQEAFWDPNRMYSEQTFAAAKALLLYEVRQIYQSAALYTADS